MIGGLHAYTVIIQISIKVCFLRLLYATKIPRNIVDFAQKLRQKLRQKLKQKLVSAHVFF